MDTTILTPDEFWEKSIAFPTEERAVLYGAYASLYGKYEKNVCHQLGYCISDACFGAIFESGWSVTDEWYNDDGDNVVTINYKNYSVDVNLSGNEEQGYIIDNYDFKEDDFIEKECTADQAFLNSLKFMDYPSEVLEDDSITDEQFAELDKAWENLITNLESIIAF